MQKSIRSSIDSNKDHFARKYTNIYPQKGWEKEFRKFVYSYFSKFGRTLPWRGEVTPYQVFISEIMLQQTQVDRVIPKYLDFIAQFPDIKLLAQAPMDSVLLKWQGLGYNRRAVSLKRASEIIVKEHKSKIPDTPGILVTLPGIGPATAASIAAFAYNKPTIFLETNIRTVLIHHFFPPERLVSDKDLFEIASLSLDKKQPAKWYSALMDYGTYLKKTLGNLSKQSLTYTKQSPFQGSHRQKRGKILKLYLQNASITPTKVAEILDIDHENAYKIMKELHKEGLIKGLENE